TQENLHLAEQIQANWKAFGLDSVQLAPYDVLLSYPNETRPNYISLIDEQGQEIFNTSLSEPVPAGYETIEDIVPPYSAFSAQGQPEVKNAYLAGAKGIILYSDPADSCAPGVQPYPDGWNLPGAGAQRGNVLLLDGAGDPLTPGYPAKEHAVQGLGFFQPIHFKFPRVVTLLVSNREMGGAPAPDNSWKGRLSVPYNVGPGFIGISSKRMHIYSFKQVRRIYNVIGILRGTTEPDRYVILGGHRDSWVFGGIDPQSGAAVVHEIVRSFGKLKQEGKENVKILQERAVAYINADSSIEGNYTLRVDCTPSMHSLVYNLTKEIPSPDEGFEGKSLFESWYEKNPSREYEGFPRINKLGSGNDFEKVDKFSSYPVYHSVYETYEIVEKFYDPTFKNHLAVAQVRGGLVFELADAVILPFDCRDYAKALNSYVDIIYNLTMKYQAAMEAHNVSLALLRDSIKTFSEVADEFHHRLQLVDINKHIIFAPNNHNKYAGVSFPGIYDALFDIDNKADQQKAWEEVKRQIFIAAFTVRAAAGTLNETPCGDASEELPSKVQQSHT
ncbi:hypothetical protein Chor_000120, partial [Crotalus horridus]